MFKELCIYFYTVHFGDYVVHFLYFTPNFTHSDGGVLCRLNFLLACGDEGTNKSIRCRVS